MRVDMHMHTKDWSDGQATAAEMIETAIERGLDGVVITDHDRMLLPEDQEALQRRYPRCRIFRGCEMSIARDHVLVIGGTGRVVPLTTPETVGDLGRFARETGALTVFAHPFWIDPTFKYNLDDFCPDAMDLLSMNVDTAPARFDIYRRVAQERGMQLVACSDAHSTEHVGLYHIDLDNDVRDDADLVREVRAGRFCIATFENLWRERVEEIGPAEELARAVLHEGGTVEEFLARGGRHACFFTRVEEGGSYLPSRNLIGLRGSDLGIAPQE